MIKKILLLGFLVFLANPSARPQLYSFGIKGGMGYSSYKLSNNYVFYQTEGNSLTFNAGIFGRRYLKKWFIETGPEFTLGRKASMTFRNRENSFSKLSLGLPVIFGRNFYPGNIRVYAGVLPELFFGEDKIEDFLIANRLIHEGNATESQSLSFIVGSGVDLARFALDLAYSRPFLGGFFMEEKNPEIKTYHRFSALTINISFRLR